MIWVIYYNYGVRSIEIIYILCSDFVPVKTLQEQYFCTLMQTFHGCSKDALYFQVDFGHHGYLHLFIDLVEGFVLLYILN
jgi:hypothetical protein